MAVISHIILSHSSGLSAYGSLLCAQLPSRGAVGSSHTIHSSFSDSRGLKIQTSTLAFFEADKARKISFFSERTSSPL